MRQSALKIERIPETQHPLLSEVDAALKEFVDDLPLGYGREAEPIECRSRGGYIPHSWNHGGWSCIGFTCISHCIRSGIWPGNGAAEEIGTKYYNERHDEMLSNNGLDELTEELHGQLHDEFCDDYASVMVETQARYLGFNEDTGTHEVEILTFVSVSDAPYFRNSDEHIEHTCEFKTIDQLKDFLAKVQPEHEAYIGDCELT